MSILIGYFIDNIISIFKISSILIVNFSYFSTFFLRVLIIFLIFLSLIISCICHWYSRKQGKMQSWNSMMVAWGNIFIVDKHIHASYWVFLARFSILLIFKSGTCMRILDHRSKLHRGIRGWIFQILFQLNLDLIS